MCERASVSGRLTPSAPGSCFPYFPIGPVSVSLSRIHPPAPRSRVLTEDSGVSRQPTLANWRIVFMTAAGFFAFGNTVFCAFGTAKQQKWNEPLAMYENNLDLAYSNAAEKGQKVGDKANEKTQRDNWTRKKTVLWWAMCTSQAPTDVIATIIVWTHRVTDFLRHHLPGTHRQPDIGWSSGLS